MKTSREDHILLAIAEIMDTLNLLLTIVMDESTRGLAGKSLDRAAAYITSWQLEKLDGEPIAQEEGK